MDLQVSGQDDTQILPESNTWATVEWDGRDAYGRLIGGSSESIITVAYEWTTWDYGAIFGGPELSREFPELFGNDGNDTSFEGHAGTTLAVGETFQEVLTVPDHRALGFGGWSPTVLHRFDPVAGILYYGDGRIRTVPQLPAQDNFLGQIASLQRVVAAAPDGSLYFDGQLTGRGSQSFIFRRLPDGTFQIVTAPIGPGTVYPNGSDWTKVDGQSVTNVSVIGVDFETMCVGPDGSLYVTDGSAIARLTPDGTWHVILGLNVPASATLQPDGTPAQNSVMTSGGGVAMAVGPDNSVYFTTTWDDLNGTNYSMIRKIAPNGNLYTVFAAPGAPVSGETSAIYWNTLFGSSAFSAPYASTPIEAIAVGSDGTVYVSPGEYFDGGGMFEISPGGIIQPLLSDGPGTGAGAGYNPANTNNAALIRGDEGKQATTVTTGSDPAHSMAVGPDGSVYFTSDDIIVWRINPNGILERVAGRFGSTNYNAPNYPIDGADPLNTYMYTVVALTVTPNDTLALLTTQAPYIVLYPERSSQQGLLTPIETQEIPSEDGSEIYVFDQNGRHLSTLDSLTGGTEWTFAYDTNSLVVTMTDAAGLVTRIQRNGAGQPTAIVGPYGHTTTLGVDANGFLNAVSNPADETTTMTSTTNGLLSSITGPLGDTYTLNYDSLGHVMQISDPLGGGWTDTRTEVGPLPDMSYEANIACVNSLGDTRARDMNLGTDGDTTVAFYDGTNVTEGSTLTPDGNETFGLSDGATAYFGVGADPRFGSQAQQTTSMLLQVNTNLPYYSVSIQRSAGLTNSADPLSLTGLTNITTVNGNSYTSTYNPGNRTVTLTSPVGRTNSAVSDALGRIIHVASPGQPVFDRVFDASGRLAMVTSTSSAGIAQATLSYDSLGELSTVTDPLGRTNAISYNVAGRPKQLTLADGSIIAFTLDSENNLTALVPPGRPAHTFQYNPVGLLTKYTPPLVGTDDSVSYEYDTERNLTQVNFPDGQTMTLAHGLAGRVEQVVLGAGPTLSFEYGQHTLQLVGVASSTGDSVQLGYAGPILTNVSWSGSISGNVTVQLNTDLLPSSEAVDGAAPIAYSYDNDQLLTQAGALSIAHDPATGFATGTTLGGVTDQRQLDDRGLLTNYSASVNGVSIWSLLLSYDLIGRITNRVETVGGVTNSSGYIYDIDGRLQQVWQNGVLGVTYTYDTNGNRLTRNDETATYDAQDRVQSYAGTTFGWSPNGTLQSSSDGGQTTNYTYDVRGALTAVALPGGTEIGYTIDAAGRRIGKSIGGKLVQGFLYDSTRVVAELDGASELVSQFIYGSKPNVPDYMINGANTYRIISDERESVRMVVNIADGSIAQQIDYDEFGRVQSDTSPGFQPFGFAGGLYDSDTGLVRFGFRDYSPLTGQWTTRDPLRFQGGQPSLYSYAGNDPLNSIDPVGLGPDWVRLFWGVAGSAIGIATIALGATAAAPFSVVALVTIGLVGTGFSAGNALVAVTNPNAPVMPTSFGGFGALFAGNSPTAQWVGFFFDLGTTGFSARTVSTSVESLSAASARAAAIENTTEAYNGAAKAIQAMKIEEHGHLVVEAAEGCHKLTETGEGGSGEGSGGGE